MDNRLTTRITGAGTAVAAATLLGLAGCDDETKVESVAESIETHVDETADSIDDAADEVGDAIEDTTDEIEDAADGT